ncbi:MAG: LytTR family transcriptional regulator [Chitinophagaceae bacterium]|nr:LytTR family transcriptional regulator [Chitinophagaceae bacterium]
MTCGIFLFLKFYLLITWFLRSSICCCCSCTALTSGTTIDEITGDRHIETLLHNIGHKNGSQKMKLCIPSVKDFQVIDIQDIIHCEASGNYSNFHFLNHPLICASKPIHEYETLLGDSNFVRIHKSFLVNLEVLLSNGHEVEVSRRKKDLLMERMKAYYKF